MARKRFLSTFAAIALILAVACSGSDAAPATSVPPTSAPVPTATSFVPPTVERLLESISGAGWELLGLTTIRDVPVALEGESPRLPAEEVTELWNNFFGGIRLADDVSGRQFFEFCSDGTGKYLDWWTEGPSLIAGGLAGETFTWEIAKDRGAGWNGAKLQLTLDDSTINPIGATTNFVFERQNGDWHNTREGIENVFLDSPDCD